MVYYVVILQARVQELEEELEAERSARSKVQNNMYILFK